MQKKKNNILPFITALMILVSFLLLSGTFFDNDGWFLLNNGRYIIEYGVPMKNPFTWMKGLDIIIQQWLWSVIVYVVYNGLGSWGLILMCIGMYFFAMFLYVKICALYKVPYPRAVCLASVALLLMYQFLSIRPTFITIILLLWQVYILEKYKKDHDIINLIWLVVISFFEVNLHSAIWVFHFVFLLPYLVPEIRTIFVRFQKRPMKRAPILFVSIFMFLAGFLNPYGYKGMFYLFYSYGDELMKAGINELKVPAFDNVGLLILVLMIFITVWLSKNKTVKLQSSFFYILCGTFILSLSHTRNSVYFFLGCMLFGIEILKNTRLDFIYLDKKIIASALALLSILLVPVAISTITKTPDVKDSANTPVKAIGYLQENHISVASRLYTEFNSGGYIGWNGYQTFMDARPELYFEEINGKKDIFQDYIKIRHETDEKEFRKFLDEYRFEWMIISDKEPLRMYLEMSGDGEAVVKGNGYKLYKMRN